jgi:putative endonuclease
MAESHDLGQRGEEEAARYLAEKGYRILCRNWKSGRLEIDIIAETEEFMVFAEVKTRSEDYLLDPASAVTSGKQKSLILAAESYIKRYRIDKDSRFDIISIIRKGSHYQIEHIENAYYPGLK